MPSAVRSVLFWLMMIALTVVLWQMASNSTSKKPDSAMNYSEFMSQVDKNNIAAAKLAESQSTAEIEGQLRDSAQKFTVTIPKEVIPDLTERLRKQGVAIVVSGSAEPNWASMVINLSPIILIVCIWVFMMRQMRARRDQPRPGDSSSRPIQ